MTIKSFVSNLASRGRLAASVTALATVASVAFGGQAVANAAPAATLTQGDQVITADGSSCTVGYVQGDRAWFAAHCALNGQQVYNSDGVHLGTARWFRPGGPATFDLAYIQFAAGTVSGGNPHTGDGIRPVPPEGSEVCIQGRRTGKDCAPAVRGLRMGEGMFHAGAMPKAHGDSGSGVSQARQNGVVGIYSGTTIVTHDRGETVYSNYARMPYANEFASLRHKGYVPRIGNLPRTVQPHELPGYRLREFTEQAEALSSTSSEGPTLDTLRGIGINYGVTF